MSRIKHCKSTSPWDRQSCPSLDTLLASKGMKTFIALFVFFAALTFNSPQASAQEIVDPSENPQSRIPHLCEQIPLEPMPLTFCFEKPKETQTTTHVVYFFHGIRGSAEEFFSGAYALALRALQQHLGDKAPLFVSLSFGPEGIIKDEIGGRLHGALSVIETRLGLSGQIRRDLVGASMGGHNASQVAAAGSKAFNSLTLLCPALIDFDPHDAEQLKKYRERHSAYLNNDFFEYLLKVFRREFPTSAAWNANTPFGYMNQGAFDGLPMFISVGRRDTLGFAEGAELFSKQFQARQGSAQWEPVWGPHCIFNVSALVRFLTP